MMTEQHSNASLLAKKVVMFIKSAHNASASCPTTSAQTIVLSTVPCGLEHPYGDQDGSKHFLLDDAALGSSWDGHQEVFQAQDLNINVLMMYSLTVAGY